MTPKLFWYMSEKNLWNIFFSMAVKIQYLFKKKENRTVILQHIAHSVIWLDHLSHHLNFWCYKQSSSNSNNNITKYLKKYFLNFFLIGPLPTFKNYWEPQKSFCLYWLYLSIFTVLKIKTDAFAATSTSQNCLMGF